MTNFLNYILHSNIINFIMLLAKRLDVKTIVEGVETEEQV